LLAVDLGFELLPVPQVVIAGAVLEGNLDLAAREVVLVAINNGPERLAMARAFAGEGAVAQRVRVRCLIGADEKIGKGSFAPGDAPQSGGVAGRDLVPDAPNVFPGLIAYTVKEGILQVVGLIAIPAVTHVDHVAWLQPLVLADHRNKR